MPGLLIYGMGAGGASQTFALQSVNVSSGQLDLVFSSPVALIGAANDPASWSIEALTPGVPAPTIYSVEVVLSNGQNTETVRLTTSEDKNGASYVLHCPDAGIVGWATSLNWTGPFAQPFTGTGTPPTIIMARSIDARIMEVIFSEAVIESEALNPANYSIPGLVCTGVTKITDLVYRVTTTKQNINANYTVTVSNIHDLAGNLVQ